MHQFSTPPHRKHHAACRLEMWGGVDSRNGHLPSPPTSYSLLSKQQSPHRGFSARRWQSHLHLQIRDSGSSVASFLGDNPGRKHSNKEI